MATGRRGADWLEKLCAEHGIAHQPGTVDIGVRVECRNEVMEEVNSVLYESKLIGYPQARSRTRCAPSARTPAALSARKTTTTTSPSSTATATRISRATTPTSPFCARHNFSVPFNQPIAYAQKVGELTNMLGNGPHSRAALRRHSRRQAHLAEGAGAVATSRPTLPDAVAGDITAAMPYRAMTNIINFIQAVDHRRAGLCLLLKRCCIRRN